MKSKFNILFISFLLFPVILVAQDNNVFGKYIPEIDEWDQTEPIESIINIGDSKLITVIKTYSKGSSNIAFTLSCGKKDLVTTASGIDLSDFTKLTLDGFETYKVHSREIGIGSVYLKILEKDDLKGEILINYIEVDDSEMDDILNEFDFKGIYFELIKLLK
ncbi:hypothetical protein ACFLTE_03790 [Bacteroidota bacterium]